MAVFVLFLCLPVAGSLDTPTAADTLTPRSSDGTTLASEVFDQFSANITEHRTHEGYLYKRGALLKGWKQRWFVLDSMKHQVGELHCWNVAGNLGEVFNFFPLSGEFTSSPSFLPIFGAQIIQKKIIVKWSIDFP